MLEVIAGLCVVAVALCTAFNCYGVVSVRSTAQVTQVSVRHAVWCGVAALSGIALLWLLSSL